MQNYFILDMETCPIDLEAYFSLNEEEQTKKLNPIDSKIIAIGIRHNNKNTIFQSDNEKQILTEFWSYWKELKTENSKLVCVGFNITNFDISFLTTRSFINNVKVIPFVIKDIVDVKSKITAFRFGPTRGKLKEFAKIMNIETLDIEGKDVAMLCKEKKIKEIKKYLEKDLEITDALYKRLVETGIIDISRW